MTLFGVRVEQERGAVEFSNRFFTAADSLDGALDNAEDIWTVMKQGIGSSVQCVNVHAWAIGATPRQFKKRPVGEYGVQAILNPLKLEIVARFTYGAQNSYPYYSDFRVSMSKDQLEGVTWDSDYQVILDVMKSGFQALITADKMVLKTGDSLGEVGYESDYKFHQLNKRWYNRAP